MSDGCSWSDNQNVPGLSLLSRRAIRPSRAAKKAAIHSRCGSRAGLGFGANTAIFSVIQAFILSPIPFSEPDRLVAVWEKNPALGGFLAERLPASLKNYLEWKRQNHSFESMGAFQEGTFNVTGVEKPEEVSGAVATTDFFSVLRVQPRFGRGFAAGEGTPGKNHVVILGPAYHQRRFGGTASAIGRTPTLNGVVFTIIGAMPPDFHLPALWEGLDRKNPDVWLPLNETAKNEEAANRICFTFARLRPGVSVEQARSEMQVIGKRLEQAYPEMNTNFSVSVFPLLREDVGPAMHRGAVILQFAVAFVLLIACANIANLLLTRAAAREKEMAVRLALGASRGAIIRQVLVESLLLGAMAGVAGVVIGLWLIRLIGAVAPEDAYHLHELHLNVVVLALTFGMVFLAALLCGLAPAWYSAGRNVNEALVKGGRSSSGGISTRLRNTLVTSEVALAAVLLVGSALMIRSLSTMLSVDPGFRSDHVLTMHVRMPSSKYSKPEQVKLFCDQLLARVAAIPGVESTAITSGLPMLDSISVSGFGVVGRPDRPGSTPVTDAKYVSENYFDTVRQPILRGRVFTRQDAEQDPPTVAIVNEASARQISPDGNALGKLIFVGRPDHKFTVVGIAANTHQMGLDSTTRPEVDIPTRSISHLALAVRTTGDPMRLATAVESQVSAIDKDQPVSEIKTLSDRTAEGNARRRFDAFLFGSFAALALILAAIGLYGVLSYAVAQRTREIGIRMALGADRGTVTRMIVTNGATVAALGLTIGLVAAVVLTRLMGGLLYGVSATDPVAFGLAAATLLPVALLACYVPARRASRIDPMVSLRVE